jgi:CheY-like chemotaxis protein/HPt (histidine-containing phosphotransfer) domain-containing protein
LGVACGAPRGRAGADSVTGQAIAIIDDDADARLLAAAVLRGGGYAPVEDVGAPGVGVRLACDRPALILLDMQLGARTGADALVEIRAVDALRAVPVVALTGARAGDPSLVRLGAELAGVASKPIDPEALLALVAAVLGRPADAAAPVPDARDPAAAGAAAAATPGGSPAGPPDGDPLAPLRARFLAGLAGRLARIRAALAAGDAAGLILETHRLRGAAAGHGFRELADAAGRAEDAARAGTDVATAVAALETAAGRVGPFPRTTAGPDPP